MRNVRAQRPKKQSFRGSSSLATKIMPAAPAHHLLADSTIRKPSAGQDTRCAIQARVRCVRHGSRSAPRVRGSAVNSRSERCCVRYGSTISTMGETMPEANSQPDVPQAQEAEVTAKSPLDAILEAQDNPTPEEEAEEQDEAEENEAEERKLTALLRKAEQAFCRGKKAELLSRVDCGKWCHEVYSYRLEQGHKDRGFTSQLIFNRLAIHADSKREC